MGMVATVFKVYTDDPDNVSRSIASELKPKGIQVEDVAFGIKIIKVMFVHEDSEGSNIFEDKLRKVKGVKEVEVSEESLL